MKHPRAARWDDTMRELFDEIDDWLEERYGQRYPLHPNRPARGRTASREMDGLFNVGADFTAGFGSRHGRGYVVSMRLATLESVPTAVREEIESDVVRLLGEKLPQKFPGRRLEVRRDGTLLKIVGDLSLGPASAP